MSAAGLLAGLRHLLASIGGWFLDELLGEGAFAGAAYCRMYARKLAARRDESSSESRRARLAARAQRWLASARWLADHAWRLRRFVLARYRERCADIPRVAELESMEGFA